MPNVADELSNLTGWLNTAEVKRMYSAKQLEQLVSKVREKLEKYDADECIISASPHLLMWHPEARQST